MSKTELFSSSGCRCTGGCWGAVARLGVWCGVGEEVSEIIRDAKRRRGRARGGEGISTVVSNLGFVDSDSKRRGDGGGGEVRGGGEGVGEGRRGCVRCGVVLGICEYRC